MSITGRIHSVETFGTVDGPGIRYVVFLQGCPLRCQYCHNPDTWDMTCGKVVTVDELIMRIKEYLSFLQNTGGGVTASGGEPTLQPVFVTELFRQVKVLGLNTALDTSGFVDPAQITELLAVTDLVLLDIKHIDPVKHQLITGQSNAKTLAFAQYLSDKQIPVWIRYVLVPGLSDDLADVRKLAVFLQGLKNIKRIEVLSYHTMGVYKWAELALEYKLAGVEPPTPESVEAVRRVLAETGLLVIAS